MIRRLAAITLVAFPLAATAAGESPTSEAGCALAESIRATPPNDPNAAPFGPGPWYINADRTIWAGMDIHHLVARPDGNKVLWIRPRGTDLVLSGRRLDAEAPPMTAHVPCCYPTGFQASGLIFPTEGCWEVTAQAGRHTLTFVAKVSAPLVAAAAR
jgi:hypothetical protein